MGEYTQHVTQEGPWEESPEPGTMPIAIVGMSCRLPGGADNPDKLWDLIVNGRSAWSDIPESRFNRKAWYHPDKEHIGTTFVQGGYFLEEDLARFDASFFNFSAEVASTMDPEVRMQLEGVFEAFESAGLSIEDVAGSETSVYAGTCFRDFHDSHMRDPSTLARFFLTGPSISVDTGCSTTLTALHLACQSLRTGEAKMAVVGGSNALVNPDMFISGTSLGLLSPEGKCFAFDSRASGYGRGEGTATLILKPLVDAVRDGNPIRAVIRQTAANQDGKTPTLTSPSREAQEQLIKSCYATAGLDPRNTGYVEAHGTGTQAGDTNEAAAIGTALSANRTSPLLIGSVKTNIGHTEATSGLAGIIKAVLAIEKNAIPPSINIDQPNPNIPFSKLGIEVARAVQSWPDSSKIRASVNNFGYGGANAHAIVEDARYLVPYYKRKLQIPEAIVSSQKRPRLFRISAKDEATSHLQAANLQRYVQGKLDMFKGVDAERFLDQLAYTLNQKRSRFPWNSVVSASSIQELVETLGSTPTKSQRASKVPRIGFVFSGQGAQWYAMGRELIESYPVFREALEEADKCLLDLGAEWSLLDELQRDEDTSRVNEVILSLPSCVAIQLAIVRLLHSWGIRPTGVTGHSSGEVGAAFAAGVVGMKSALTIVYTRGALTTAFQRVLGSHGGMLAAGLSREEAVPYITSLKEGKVVVACINSPSSVTLSGDLAGIHELENILHAKGIFARRLKVEAAYHSHHMEPLAADYLKALASFLPETREYDGDVIFSSPVTGSRMSPSEAGCPAHWVKNMIQPVEFRDCLSHMCQDPSSTTSDIDILLEIGPHSTLQGPIRQIVASTELKSRGITYYPTLVRNRNAVETMQQLACDLTAQGYPVDLGAVGFPNGTHGLEVLTDLPRYAWNHQAQHWTEPRMNKVLRSRQLPVHDLLGTPTLDSHPLARRWRHIIRPSEMPWVRDHQIQANVIYPAAGYISMAIEACSQSADQASDISSYSLLRVDIMKALMIPDTAEGVEVQTCLYPSDDSILSSQGWQTFQIFSVDNSEGWSLHCEGLVKASFDPKTSEVASNWRGAEKNIARPKMQGRFRKLNPEALYDSLRASGLNHGPAFQNITAVRIGDGISSCDIRIADTAATMPFQFQQTHVLHPTTLDTIFQAVYTALPDTEKGRNDSMVPKSIESIYISSDIPAIAATPLLVDSVLRKFTTAGFLSDVTVTAEVAELHNSSLINIKGLFCKSLGTTIQLGDDLDKSKIAFTTLWEPDLTLLTTDGLSQALLRNTSNVGCVEGLSHKEKSDWVTSCLLPNLVPAMPQTVEVLPLISPRLTRNYSLENTVSFITGMFAHKRPGLKILDFGGSQGHLCSTILSAPDGMTAKVASYTYMDTSEQSIEAAKETCAKYGDLVIFKQFIAGQSLDNQNITAGNYDIVIVPSDMAVTGEENDTLFRDFGGMTGPGGLLLMSLPASGEWLSTIDFSLFAGQTHTITVSSTTRLLLSFQDEVHTPEYPSELVVVYKGARPPQKWLGQLQGSIASLNTQSFANVYDVHEKTVIFLDDPTQPVLVQPTSDEFAIIKAISTTARGILWVSRGGEMGCENPDAALQAGFLRTLRCEQPLKQYISVDLETSLPLWRREDALLLSEIFSNSFDYSRSRRTPVETEYAVRASVALIPRVVEDVEQNIDISQVPKEPELMPFFNKNRNIRLSACTPGLLDSLTFTDDDTVSGPLAAESVEIRPAAFGLNFRDVMVAMGQLDETRMGFECSGYITAVGPEAARRGFEVGDRVYAFLRGYFANTIRIHHTSIAKIPEGMDMETAASIPLVFITAYHSLYNMARLKKGETILIHSGTGGVGQAAIMMAQIAKAEIFVTVGSREKQEFITSTYGIAADHIFNSRNDSFATDIMAATNGKGVDVVLNSLAGPLLRATWNCIATFGRFIEIGKRDLELNNNLEMAPFIRSVSFSSLDLITLGTLRGDIVADIFIQINALIRVGCLKAVSPIKTFSISEAEKAFRTMQAGKHMGKIVLVPRDGDLVKTVAISRDIQLSSDFSYLIVGGFGGIGRSIVNWMIRRGAKNLILLSRNAEVSASQNESFLEEIKHSGARVLVEGCDVANQSQLTNSLEKIKKQMPPIKGVIQAAMVLRDMLLEKMTIADYNAAVQPKVHGSWNLHQLLPADLEFFVMLSSVSGVGGNATQANYAAGGTFQDALARHRAAHGQAAVSLGLGAVKGVGVLAGFEGKKVASRFERLGLRTLDEDEVLRLVEDAIRNPKRTIAKSHVITGIPPSWVGPEGENGRPDPTAAFWMRDMRFSALERSHQDGPQKTIANGDGTSNLVAMFSNTQITNEVVAEAFSKALVAKLATMFVVPEAEIDILSPLARLGVDSLIAVELRNWVAVAVRTECSVFDVMQAPSIVALAEKLVIKGRKTSE